MTAVHDAYQAMQKAAEDAISLLPDTDDNLHFRVAAQAKLIELTVIVAQASGIPYDFSRDFAPLARAIDDTVKAIDSKINESVVYDSHSAPSEDEVDWLIAQRESANQWLDQARITGVLFLAHLTAARKLL